MSVHLKQRNIISEPVLKLVESATQKIMPAWPLDMSVAVNPWFSQIDTSHKSIMSMISTISASNLLIPAEIFEKFQAEREFDKNEIIEAIEKNNNQVSPEALLQYLNGGAIFIDKFKTIAATLDSLKPNANHILIDVVVNNISEACADYYTQAQSLEVNMTKNIFGHQLFALCPLYPVVPVPPGTPIRSSACRTNS